MAEVQTDIMVEQGWSARMRVLEVDDYAVITQGDTTVESQPGVAFVEDEWVVKPGDGVSVALSDTQGPFFSFRYQLTPDLRRREYFTFRGALVFASRFPWHARLVAQERLALA